MEKYLMGCWPGENTLEDVAIWGIDPLNTLNEIFDRYIFEEDTELVFLHYELKSKLDNLEKILCRYDLYEMLLCSRLKELAPDDPLVADGKGEVQKEIQRRKELAEQRKAGVDKETIDFQIKAGKRVAEVMQKHDISLDAIHDLIMAICKKGDSGEPMRATG